MLRKETNRIRGIEPRNNQKSDLRITLIVIVQPLHLRHLRNTRNAPGTPQVQEDNMALIVGQPLHLSVQGAIQHVPSHLRLARQSRGMHPFADPMQHQSEKGRRRTHKH